tara:strand:+ start:243 stop:545 length:303 start_codon:yes stop_codon:yes gene_type:complete
MKDVVKAGHLGTLPDDVCYNAVEVCVDAIAEDVEVEAPVYTHIFTEWLADNLSNISYLDDALAEYGDVPSSGLDMLTSAYMLWMGEVLEAVSVSLQAHAE